MVEKFKALLPSIERDKGAVSLFAILKIDEYTDKWSVLMSATWITEANRDEVFAYLIDLIIKRFSEAEVDTIARVGVFVLQQHLVQELLKYKENARIEGSIPINGNIVHEAYILASRKGSEQQSPLNLA